MLCNSGLRWSTYVQVVLLCFATEGRSGLRSLIVFGTQGHAGLRRTPRIVLEVSMLTKWSLECRSYIVFCISVVAPRNVLDVSI